MDLLAEIQERVIPESATSAETTNLILAETSSSMKS
jgi:hypothetical protein